MTKKDEVINLAEKLSREGMDFELAKKNLMECDQYFIDALKKILYKI